MNLTEGVVRQSESTGPVNARKTGTHRNEPKSMNINYSEER